MQASLSSHLIGALTILAAVSLASCSSDDDDKDIIEQVTIFVSAERGTYNNFPGNTFVKEMMIREQGESTFINKSKRL